MVGALSLLAGLRYDRYWGPLRRGKNEKGNGGEQEQADREVEEKVKKGQTGLGVDMDDVEEESIVEGKTEVGREPEVGEQAGFDSARRNSM